MRSRQKQDYAVVGLAALLSSGVGFAFRKPFFEDLPAVITPPAPCITRPSATLYADLAYIERVPVPPPENFSLLLSKKEDTPASRSYTPSNPIVQTNLNMCPFPFRHFH